MSIATTVVAVATTESALTTVATGTTFAFGTCGTLYIAFGFGKEFTVRKTKFAALLVYFEKLNFDFVAFVEYVFNVFDAFPINFRYMEKSLFTRENLNKCSERLNRCNFAFVCFANLLLIKSSPSA